MSLFFFYSSCKLYGFILFYLFSLFHCLVDTDSLSYCSTDKMSEAAILNVVRKNFQDHLILGEEGGLIGDSSSDYLWCIDPLGLTPELSCFNVQLT